MEVIPVAAAAPVVGSSMQKPPTTKQEIKKAVTKMYKQYAPDKLSDTAFVDRLVDHFVDEHGFQASWSELRKTCEKTYSCDLNIYLDSAPGNNNSNNNISSNSSNVIQVPTNTIQVMQVDAIRPLEFRGKSYWRGRCGICCHPDVAKKCNYYQACGICFGMSCPFLIYFLILLGILQRFQSIGTQGIDIQVSLRSIELKDWCKTTGASILVGLEAHPVALPFSAGLGKTQVLFEKYENGVYTSIATLSLLPATGLWATDNVSLLVNLPRNASGRSTVGFEIASDDPDTFYTMLSQLQEDQRAGAKKVTPMKVRMTIEAAVYLTELGATGLFVKIQQSEPMTLPLKMDTAAPNTSCTTCGAAEIREAQAATANTSPSPSPFDTDGFDPLALKLLDLKEISNKLMDVNIGVGSNHIEVTGDSAFQAQWEFSVGLNEQPVLATSLGTDSVNNLLTLGLTVDGATHEPTMHSLMKWLTAATREEELDGRLPVRVKRASSDTTASTCFMENVLESVDFKLNAAVPSFSFLSGTTFNDLACKLATPRDVCTYTAAGDKPTTLKDGKCERPAKLPDRCRADYVASPAPASSSGGGGGGTGFANINLAIIPTGIEWMQSTRTDAFKWRFTWKTVNVNAFADFVKGWEKVTAPLAFEERNTKTSIQFSVGVPDTGGLYLDLEICFTGPCHETGPTSATDPILLNKLLNGLLLNNEYSMQYSDQGLVLGRILSVFAVTHTVPPSDDRIRARIMDWLLATSPSGTSSDDTLYSTFKETTVTTEKASALHTHAITLPGIILGALPNMDFGAPTIEGKPSGDAEWVSPFVKIAMSGSVDTKIELKTTVDLTHPTESVLAKAQESQFWGKMFQCQTHPVVVEMKNKGTQLRFTWNVPGGILDSRGGNEALLSAPRIVSESFTGSTNENSNMCSAQHSLTLNVSNPTPYSMELFTEDTAYACATLQKKVNIEKTYVLGCAHGRDDQTITMKAFEYGKDHSLKIQTTAGASPSTYDMGPANLDATTIAASTGDGCADVRKDFNSHLVTGETELSWSTVSNDFTAGSAPVSTGIKLGGNYLIPLTDVKMTVPPPADNCDLPTEAMKTAAAITPLALKFGMPAAATASTTTPLKVVMPSMAKLSDWNVDAQAFGTFAPDALPPTIFVANIGGGSFWTVVLLALLGIIVLISMCCCLCYRDGISCAAMCCKGSGTKVLPCGMSPKVVRLENSVNNLLDRCPCCKRATSPRVAGTDGSLDGARYNAANSESSSQ